MPPENNPAPSLTLLIKLLKMTASNHDNEALVAMRKATAELQKFGGDWETLLRGKVTVIGDPFENLRKPEPGTTTPPRAQAPPPPAPPPRPRAYPQSPPRPAPRPQASPRPATPPPKAAAPRPTAKPPAWSNRPKPGSVKLEELI